MEKNYIEQCVFAGSLLDLVNSAAYFIDLNERFVYINKTAEKLDGYTNEELYGKTVKESYNLDDTPLVRALRTNSPVKDITFRYYVNGVKVLQICNAYPFFIDGKKVGAYTVQRDVTKINEIIENNLYLQQRVFPGTIPDEFTKDRSELSFENQFSNLIGQHPSFVSALSRAALAAQNDSSVFLTGSTGSGKEVFAQSIHQASSRKNKTFLAINCAAIPEQLLEGILFGTEKGAYTGAVDKAGVFEQANGGTIFLDEINSMPKYSQSKLLRVLEEKKVQRLGGTTAIPIDVRIISSSNGLSNNGDDPIREDLFYRLAVIHVVIPDLVERRSDIPLLTEYYIAYYNKKFQKNVLGLDWEMSRFFNQYSWPGNVRQLKNSLESAMNFIGDNETLIRKEHFPQYLFGRAFQGFEEEHSSNFEHLSRKKTEVLPQNEERGVFEEIRRAERSRIIEALKMHDGNITQTAKYLGMHRQSLIYRIKKYNIR